jgi:hypothetical protein
VTSKGALKWLARLEKPRSLDSLISEVFGEAVLFGGLFEREVADFLNFYEFDRNPLEWMVKEPITTKIHLSELIKKAKQCGLPTEACECLADGNAARNELVHQVFGKSIVMSGADKEMLLAEIDALCFRIWHAFKLARDLKKTYAARIGVLESDVSETVAKLRREAEIEDQNVERILNRSLEEPPD